MKTIIIIGALLLFTFFSCDRNTNKIIQYKVEDNYVPSGYMGDTQNITVSSNYKDSSRSDSMCTKFLYSPGADGYGGIYWQYPANNWCNRKGRDLSELQFNRLTFYAKGEIGGEVVRFRVGQDCGDSFVSDELAKRLTNKWVKYYINVSDKNLSNIAGAFSWIIDSKANHSQKVTFYLDDIQFER